MTIQATIPTANGTYPIDVGDMLGQVDVLLVARNPAANGAIRVQGVTWAGETVQIGGAAALSMAALAGGPLRASDFGHFRQLVVTVSGVTAPGGPMEVLAISTATTGPDGLYTGFRAIITQNYVETNTKLGSQFYFRVTATIAAGASWHLGFLTGAQTVLVKARDCYAAAESLALSVFKAPTYTGGTPIVVENYNDINPVASTVTAAADVSVSDNGTQWGGSEHVFGQSAVGQRTGAGLPQGGERVLAPNKAYMVRLTNNGAGPISADYFLTWFEGTPDLPRS